MPKQVKVCTVLAESDLSNTRKTLSKIEKTSSFFELRADYFDNLDELMVFKLKKLFSLPTIFTLKTQKNGGKFIDDESKQATILQAAIDAKYEFIDLDIDSKLIKKLDKKSTKYILSYHNFQSTPSYTELKKIITKARKKDADLIKIAAMVNKDEDLYILAKLLLNEQKDKKLIIVGMGELGKISRVFFPFLGSFLTYAASNNKIASGQLTLKEMQNHVF